jgi:hypothetical protein
MKQLVGILLIFCSFQGIAQTDIIEYRSHSGNMAKFTKHSVRAIDGVYTNFGDVPMERIKTAALDTIRFLEDGVALMVTSEYCRSEYIYDPIPLNDCSPRSAYGQLWKAGTDTLRDHPLFNQNHSLDSIKEILMSTYNFQNSIDSVVFIGYDNAPIEIRKGKKSLQNINPEARATPKEGSFGLTLLLSILGPILLIYILSPMIFSSSRN